MRVPPSIQALIVRSCTTASIRPAASVFPIEAFAAESDAKFLGVLRVREAVDDPPRIFMKDAVMAFAHRKVEAEGIHESAERTSAFSRRDSDLMWPAAINRGRGKFALGPLNSPH